MEKSYKHPALVYSEEPLELVIDSVPTSTRTLLGWENTSAVQAVHQLFGGDFIDDSAERLDLHI